MLLPKQGLVGLEGTVGVALVVLGEGEVAEIPLDVLVRMDVLLDRVHVQEDIDTHMVDTSVIPFLVEALRVKIAQVGSCDPEV
jgi:hypothetical protein